MKKILFVFCLLLLLCGCKSGDLNSELDYVFSMSLVEEEYHQNNTMKYFSYYLPSDMGEDPLDSESVVIRFNNSKIIMNLNVKEIINNRYYKNYYLKDDDFFVKDYLIYSNNGSYINNENNKKDYIYNLYSYKDKYIIHLATSDMNYYGALCYSDVVEATRQLMIIAKNTSISTDLIVNNYSKKDVIDYHKKQINLFDTIVPVNGELGSLLVDGAIVGDQSN